MNAQKLATAVAQLRPEYTPAEHLRIALLLSLQHPDLEPLTDAEELERQCLDITLQLRATADQHAAVSSELDSLASTEPCEFSPTHLWSLVRALKIQSHILNMYLGPEC